MGINRCLVWRCGDSGCSGALAFAWRGLGWVGEVNEKIKGGGRREHNSSLTVFVWRVMLELLEDRYICQIHPDDYKNSKRAMFHQASENMYNKCLCITPSDIIFAVSHTY